jgi:diguanylate cyclase (GGDEF)-like protein
VVLKKFSRILMENCREVDLPARYGGEEFVVLMPAVGASSAYIFADRVRTLLAESAVRFRKRRIRLTVSAGVCEWGQQAHNADAMVALADTALYLAKRSGRNRVCLADAGRDEDC